MSALPPSPAQSVRCGDMLPAAAPAPGLSVCFPHLLVAGHSATVRLRVANGLDTVLERLEVVLESRGLVRARAGRVRRLGIGQQVELLVEIEPATPGHFVLQSTVVAETGATRRSWRGACSIRVNQAPHHHIEINIGDIQCNGGPGANAGLGAEYGDVQISNLLPGARFQTLNDLLDLEIPVEFVPIPLEPDTGGRIRHSDSAVSSAGRSLRLAAAAPLVAHPGRRCVLRAEDDERVLRLVGGPRFRVGRSRTDADYVAWFWPRSTANDRRTMRLSKVQFTMRADPDGLVAWDSGSTNGTLLDGLPLARTEHHASRLHHGARLLLGRDYALRLEHHAGTGSAAPRIRGIERWDGPLAPPTALMGAVGFTPLDTEPSPISAVWLLTSGAFGSDGMNPVRLPDHGLAATQGFFHFHRHCFWIENAADNHAVEVDGRRLAEGEIMPMITGARITIGGTTWRVEIEGTP